MGHLTNTDALKGAHWMICDWTKNWSDGAWARPQDWCNMSSTGRAISSAYWKRSKFPSAKCKSYRVRRSYLTSVAKAFFFFSFWLLNSVLFEALILHFFDFEGNLFVLFYLKS